MSTRIYRLYSASIVATGDNKASLRIANKGKLTAICASFSGTAGADTTGFQRFELSKQSASSFTLNDAPNSVICHFNSTGLTVASQTFGANILLAGLAYEVFNGDTIYLHELVAGTACAAGSTISVDLFVME